MELHHPPAASFKSKRLIWRLSLGRIVAVRNGGAQGKSGAGAGGVCGWGRQPASVLLSSPHRGERSRQRRHILIGISHWDKFTALTLRYQIPCAMAALLARQTSPGIGLRLVKLAREPQCRDQIPRGHGI